MMNYIDMKKYIEEESPFVITEGNPLDISQPQETLLLGNASLYGWTWRTGWAVRKNKDTKPYLFLNGVLHTNRQELLQSLNRTTQLHNSKNFFIKIQPKEESIVVRAAKSPIKILFKDEEAKILYIPNDSEKTSEETISWLTYQKIIQKCFRLETPYNYILNPSAAQLIEGLYKKENS